jgi:hypothetical protein
MHKRTRISLQVAFAHEPERRATSVEQVVGGMRGEARRKTTRTRPGRGGWNKNDLCKQCGQKSASACVRVCVCACVAVCLCVRVRADSRLEIDFGVLSKLFPSFDRRRPNRPR